MTTLEKTNKKIKAHKNEWVSCNLF